MDASQVRTVIFRGRQGERRVCLNTASVAAYEGQIGQTAYAASKGGVVGVTLPAARDEAAHEALGKTIPFPPELGETGRFAELVKHVVANPMLAARHWRRRPASKT